MWQYYLLGRLMAQDRQREAAADRRRTEARRADRREPLTGRFGWPNLRDRHHEG